MTVQAMQETGFELTEYCNNVLVERLQTIPRVSGIRVWGERGTPCGSGSIHPKLSAYSLTALMFSGHWTEKNVELSFRKILWKQHRADG